MPFDFSGYPIDFDHAALSKRLRDTFARVAGGKDLLRHIDFEEAVANSADVQRSTPNQYAFKILEENAVDAKPETFIIASLLIRGPQENERHDLSKKLSDDLHEASRNPGNAIIQSPDMAQAFMTAMICNAQQMLAARKTGYSVHVNNIRYVAAEMTQVNVLLGSGQLRTNAPKLDKLFSDTAAQGQRILRKRNVLDLFSRKAP